MHKGNNKVWVKQWYKRQKPHWGQGANKAFKSWVVGHKPECLVFTKKFLKLLKDCYKGKIPNDVIARALVPFETE